MKEIDLSKREEFKDEIVFRKVDNTLLGYDKTIGDLYEFNETAEIIINQIKEGKSLGEVYKFLCSEFEGDEEEILYDFNNMIQQLYDLKLFKWNLYKMGS